MFVCTFIWGGASSKRARQNKGKAFPACGREVSWTQETHRYWARSSARADSVHLETLVCSVGCIVSPQKNCSSPYLLLMIVILFVNRLWSVINLRSYWIRTGLNPITGVLRRGGLDTDTGRNVTTEAEIGVMSLSRRRPIIASNHQKLGIKDGCFLSTFRESIALLTPCFWISSFQNSVAINSCCFKPSMFVKFVMANLGQN